MKLKDGLKKYEGRLVKVGAAMGYLYIGTASEETLKELAKIDEELILKNQNTYNGYRENEGRADRIIQIRIAKAKKAKRDGWIMYSQKEGRNRRMSAEAIQSAKHYISLDEAGIKKESYALKMKYKGLAHRLKLYLENYVPLAEREIKNEYESLPEVYEGHIFIVEGVEAGDYWTLNEYKKRKEK